MNEGTIITAKSRGVTFPQAWRLDQLIQDWIEENAPQQGELKSPFNWLDVGCGRGEYVRKIPEYFQQYANDVQYYGIDQDIRCKRECEDVARESKLRNPDIRIRDIGKLSEEFQGQQFHAVTLINVLHELNADLLPELLWTMVEMCDPDGFIYIFDIQSLVWHEVEPGSLPLNEDSSTRLSQFLKTQFGLRRGEHILGPLYSHFRTTRPLFVCACLILHRAILSGRRFFPVGKCSERSVVDGIPPFCLYCVASRAYGDIRKSLDKTVVRDSNKLKLSRNNHGYSKSL